MTTLASPDTTGAAPLRGVVLYVEDEQVNFDFVDGLLSLHPGVRLIHARTGADGVRLARSERPDALLLDMHLPDISGIDVVRRLSEDIAAGLFRVILLTADRLNIDVLKAMSLGAADYLIKPVSPQALEHSLGRALAMAAERRAAGAAPTAPRS